MTLALDRPTDGRSRPIDRSIETDRPIDRSRPTDRSTDSIDARDVKRNQLDRCTSIDRPILRRSSTFIDRLSSIAIDFHRSTFIDRDRDRSRRARARGRAGACMIEDARRVSTRETPTRGVDGNRASSVERGVERGVAIGRRARPRRRASVERVSSRRCGGRVWSSLVEFGSFERRGGRKKGTRLSGGEAGARAMSASVGRPGGVMALEDGWGFMQVRRETRATRAVSFLRFGTRSGTDWRVVRAR